MFNLGDLNLSDLLNSIDNAAKETLEEPKVSATSIRMQQRRTDFQIPDGGGEDVDHEVASNSLLLLDR